MEKHAVFNLLVSLSALLAGLLLVVAGALVLSYAAYLAWELYQNPDGILPFAESLRLLTANVQQMDLGGLDPKRLIAWPFAVLVLLLQGKMGLWSVEAGARLLEAARRT